MSTRVFITGIGIVSSIGIGRTTFWENCLAGRSGAQSMDSDWITQTGLSTRIAAPVDDFDPAAAGIEPRQARILDRTTMFALAAARESLQDAGFSAFLIGSSLMDSKDPALKLRELRGEG